MRRLAPEEAAAWVIGAPFVAWAALIVAPALGEGAGAVIARLCEAARDPLQIQIADNSAAAVVAALGIYVACAAVWWSSRRNWRRREEHGSAEWGSARALCRKYRHRRARDNIILTSGVSLGLDPTRHKRNLNVLVVGGSGAGKTRGYAKPNVMQANSSMVVLDPKGEIVRATGRLLEEQGYEVRVLDLVNMERSHCYNPFAYLRTDNDVQRLSTNLFKATTPKNSMSQDPFWDTAAAMLHQALIFYLLDQAPSEEQNYTMLMELLRAGEVREEDEEYCSILDELFDRLEMEDPEHIALKYYRDYRAGSAKTLKSIQITLASRLEKFNLEGLASLTATDELDLASLGERKCALFAVIPDNDTSYNFLVSILYTQVFQQLFWLADSKYGGSLPVSVHFIMDEFANVSLPDDFDKILSVMRSRGVSASIILQNLAQLKALFEKQWESIVGNCDTFLYLGGNEQSTHKYVSELLGKETIDTTSNTRSTGRNGNWTTNWQLAGRELLTPDEVRMLDNSKAVVFIRGERPVLDNKYDLGRHPSLGRTVDGGAPPHEHGAASLEAARVTAVGWGSATAVQPEAPSAECEVLTEEELWGTFTIYPENS